MEEPNKGYDDTEEPRTVKKSTYRCAVILAVAAGFIIGVLFVNLGNRLFGATAVAINARWRKAAAEAGHAEFFVNPADYKLYWRWLPAIKRLDEKAIKLKRELEEVKRTRAGLEEKPQEKKKGKEDG